MSFRGGVSQGGLNFREGKEFRRREIYIPQKPRRMGSGQIRHHIPKRKTRPQESPSGKGNGKAKVRRSAPEVRGRSKKKGEGPLTPPELQEVQATYQGTPTRQGHKAGERCRPKHDPSPLPKRGWNGERASFQPEEKRNFNTIYVSLFQVTQICRQRDWGKGGFHDRGTREKMIYQKDKKKT